MIQEIKIKALKSIKHLTLQCSNLNLFVGKNSSGKSTFLQALLLMAQNEKAEVGLNGKLISIGEFREVRNYYMPNESIKIELWEKGKKESAWVEFKEGKDGEKYEIVTSLFENAIIDDFLDDIDSFDKEQSTFLSEDLGFHYLSCHRIGANDIYAKNMVNENDFGIDGEYSLAYLLKKESEPVSDSIAVIDEKLTNSLLEQVNYWLNYIVETNIYINDLKKTNYLQVKYNNNLANISSEALFCRPVNIGSGISYLISIIISCLGAEEDSITIIENPEIHLHPRAQSRLCEFLYFISKSGRQLFVETHSDHIFNGLRVGVANGDMCQDNMTINFFGMNEQHETQCNPIIFKEYGKIIGTNDSMDITDLFDQFEIDLDRMLGI